jgi:hypothetical protein
MLGEAETETVADSRVEPELLLHKVGDAETDRELVLVRQMLLLMLGEVVLLTVALTETEAVPDRSLVKERDGELVRATTVRETETVALTEGDPDCEEDLQEEAELVTHLVAEREKLDD